MAIPIGAFVTSTREKTKKSGKPRELAGGLLARQLAVILISAVMDQGRAFDDAIAVSLSSRSFSDMDTRDRAFARLIAATVLRRHGELEQVLQQFLQKPLPDRRGRLKAILLAAAAQLIILETPAHAAISLAVDQCRLDRDARRFDKLTNAVLRRVSEQGKEKLADINGVSANIPDWMLERWQTAYGEDGAQLIARASLREAALDLTVKPGTDINDMGGLVLPTGSVRLSGQGRIEDLPGYRDGGWWVQDAAAALPAKLLGDVAGLRVADLCAAPGGKTAQLAAAGARVTAVDASKARLKRVTENLTRLRLEAELIAADASTWKPAEAFDAVLLDAPCTATGTIRRHPDILHLKRIDDIAALIETQRSILDNAAQLVKPDGLLVYCTCSLEPEEGVDQIAHFLARNPGFGREIIKAGECGIEPDWLTEDGDLRTLPTHLTVEKPELSGMDGFFAARLRRIG